MPHYCLDYSDAKKKLMAISSQVRVFVYICHSQTTFSVPPHSNGCPSGGRICWARMHWIQSWNTWVNMCLMQIVPKEKDLGSALATRVAYVGCLVECMNQLLAMHQVSDHKYTYLVSLLFICQFSFGGSTSPQTFFTRTYQCALSNLSTEYLV